MDFISIKDASLLWDMDVSKIGKLLREGKIQGADKIGGHWLIPKGTKKPIDRRTKEGKIKNQEKFFRFPFYADLPETSFFPPLCEEERLLRQAQKDLLSCKLNDEGKVFEYLSENAENYYVKLCALFFKGVYSFLTDGGKLSDSVFLELNTELSKDFPFKEDMKILLAWYCSYTINLSSVFDFFSFDYKYDYSSTSRAMLSYLSIFRYLDKTYPIFNNSIKIEIFEIECQRLEDEGYFYEALELNMLIFGYSIITNDKKREEYHLKKSLDIAFKKDYILIASYYYYPYKESFDKLAHFYPDEFMKRIETGSIKIKYSINEYKKNKKSSLLYSVISKEDYLYISYALQSFSNKEVAEILKVSERKVAKRYTEIYQKLDIKNKKELIDFIIKTLT